MSKKPPQAPEKAPAAPHSPVSTAEVRLLNEGLRSELGANAPLGDITNTFDGVPAAPKKQVPPTSPVMSTAQARALNAKFHADMKAAEAQDALERNNAGGGSEPKHKSSSFSTPSFTERENDKKNNQKDGGQNR